MGTSMMTLSNHRITLTSVQKWTKDFFDNFPKVNNPTILEFYGNVFCLDKTCKSTRSLSFKVRIVAEQKLQLWKKSLNICTSISSGAGGQGFGRSPEYWPQNYIIMGLVLHVNVMYRPSPCALCLHLHRPLLKSARHCAARIVFCINFVKE